MSRRPWHTHTATEATREPDILTPVDVGAILRITPETAIKMAKCNSLPAFRLGKFWRFRKSDISKYIDTLVMEKEKSA